MICIIVRQAAFQDYERVVDRPAAWARAALYAGVRVPSYSAEVGLPA